MRAKCLWWTEPASIDKPEKSSPQNYLVPSPLWLGFVSKVLTSKTIIILF